MLVAFWRSRRYIEKLVAQALEEIENLDPSLNVQAIKNGLESLIKEPFEVVSQEGLPDFLQIKTSSGLILSLHIVFVRLVDQSALKPPASTKSERFWENWEETPLPEKKEKWDKEKENFLLEEVC